MRKLKALFRLLRFELPFSAGVCVVMGQLLALGKFTSTFLTIAAFLSVFLISASILVLNDYFDIETDKINAPDRPIPSKLVTPSEALYISVFLMVVGLILSFLIGIIAFICVILLSIVGFLYNRKFKRSGLLGNLMVSFSVGMTFVYGGISVGRPYNEVVWFFGLIAALIDLGEEIAADAMDVKGDLLINSNSLAIKYGKSFAIRTSTSIFFFVIVLTVIPFLFKWFSLVYLFPIIIMDFAIAYSAFKLFNSQNDEGRRYIRWLYLGATIGIIFFIIMRLFGIK